MAVMNSQADTVLACEEFGGARQTLRIAIVTETYPPEVNGVAMTVGRTIEALLRRGHGVQLIRPSQHAGDNAAPRRGLEEWLCRGLAIPRYDALRLGLPARRSLIRQWSVRRPDIVHLVTEGPLGWSALAAARRLRLPVASDFHTNFHRYTGHYGIGWLKLPIAAYLRRFHNRGDATLVPTAELARELGKQGYRNLRVVARGVDTRLFSPARRSAELRRSWGLEDNDLAVLYVGRLAAEKNLPLLTAAFAAIKAREPRARLVLVGDGPLRKRLDGNDCVLCGTRGGEDLATHYASGDLFLFPSLTETYGNVTAEALASGLAVVAYDYAAARVLIDDGHNGLLVACDDAAAFAAAALRAASDPILRAALRFRAREGVAQLDWDAITGDFVAALAAVVRSHEHKARDGLAFVAVPD